MRIIWKLPTLLVNKPIIPLMFKTFWLENGNKATQPMFSHQKKGIVLKD